MAYQARLSLADFLDAVEVAAERMRASGHRGLNHANVRRRALVTRLADDTRGACAELAVANWLGIPWSRSVNTFTGQADVGEDIDVRCTDRQNGRLVLRKKDFPGRWFVLVTGDPPNLLIHGYIRGEDGMQPQWLADPHGWGRAWWVPQSALIPVDPSGYVPPCLRQRRMAAAPA